MKIFYVLSTMISFAVLVVLILDFDKKKLAPLELID